LKKSRVLQTDKGPLPFPPQRFVERSNTTNEITSEKIISQWNKKRSTRVTRRNALFAVDEERGTEEHL
jgi:hypothetical protein